MITGALFTPGSALAAPAEGSIRGAGAPGAIAGQYIVVLNDDVASAASVSSSAHTLAAKVGGSVHESYQTAVRGFSARLSVKAAKRLAAEPSVSYVEQDHRVTLSGTQFKPTWGLDRIDQRNLPVSASYTSGSAANVTVYVLDTGVRTTHSEFGGRARSGYDFIGNDADAADCQGHGTHVAGTVAGATYGVAKNAKIVALRVLGCDGNGSYSAIIAGVDWVTRNAVKPAVANMSFGGSTSDALEAALKKSIASGVTYVLAGGNQNVNACTVSPARTPQAITVGATDASDGRAPFSNFGSCLDLFAPGVNVVSSANSGNTATTAMSGTSMATPHVAGAAALYLAAHPTATPQQVRDALVNNATSGKVTNPASGSPNKLLYIGGLSTPAPANCSPTVNGVDRLIADTATILSRITISGCAGKASVTTKITVAVKHTDRGDLALWLVAPDGTEYRLRSATTGDNVANLNATYTVNASAEPRNGAWNIKVRDAFVGDKGTLDSWTLTV